MGTGVTAWPLATAKCHAMRNMSSTYHQYITELMCELWGLYGLRLLET